MELINKLKAYIRLKDIEKAHKEKEETVNNILNLISKGKTIKEQLYLIQEVNTIFDIRLDKTLKGSLSDIEHINKHKGLDKTKK